MVLERSGYEVGEAPHGLAALDEIAVTATDLGVADLPMPHMGGIGNPVGQRRAAV